MAGSSKRKRIPENPYKPARSFKKAKYAPVAGSRSRKTFLKLENTKLKFQSDVPDFMAVKAVFCTQFSLTPGAAGVLGTASFRSNSVYDPDVAVLSKSAHGLYEYGQLYQNYTVVKSYVKLRASPSSTASAVDTWAYGVRVSDNEITPGTLLPQAIQDPKTKWNLTSLAGSQQWVTSMVDLAKEVGVIDILDEASCRGVASTSVATGTNPAQNMYINVFAGMVSSADPPKDLRCIIEITYDVVFTNPRVLADT